MHQNSRSQQVSVMIGDLRSGGMKVCPADSAMLDAYCRGVVTGRDMLAHFRQFRTLESYQAWSHDFPSININHPIADVSIEQVLSEFRECLQRRQANVLDNALR
ncbi:hypothetical protein GCM10009094_37770 [Massilia aurea]